METIIVEGAQPVDSDDIFIAVMGMTGAGKSTFIEHCTNPLERLSGHGLSSCTSQVSIHTTSVLGRTVHLIDTPGFNDSRRSDGETLQELHCITNNRFQGSAVRALNAFKKMCGEEAFCGIVVATTMWDRITTDELPKAERRHEELHARVNEDIVRRGGKLTRLSAVEIDAARILRHVVGKDRKLTLAFQQELVDGNKLIHETGAGQVLFEHLTGSLKTLQAEADQAIERIAAMAHASRKEELRELEDTVTEMTGSMRSIDEDIERTRVTLGDIRKAWDSYITREEEDISAAVQSIERQLETERDRQEAASTVQTDTARSSYGGSELASSSASGSHPSQAYQMGQRLNRRYTKHARGATRIGVIGTGLAVGQLIAAIACVVM